MEVGKVEPSTYFDDEFDQISGSVMISCSSDRIKVSSVKVYTLLDCFADIGGLLFAVNGIAFFFTFILSYHGVYHKLTSSMYSFETNESNKHENTVSIQSSTHRKPVSIFK